MATMQRIAPCLWFDDQAEEAAKLYVSIFENSGIEAVSYYGKEGFETHAQPAGRVMTVSFKLAGQSFTALNGGPQFKFTEAISLQIFCDTQDEIDRFWRKLSDGGEEGPCGWVKDKYGLSWQVTPTVLPKMLLDADSEKRERVMKAFMKMKKFDIAALERVYKGK